MRFGRQHDVKLYITVLSTSPMIDMAQLRAGSRHGRRRRHATHLERRPGYRSIRVQRGHYFQVGATFFTASLVQLDAICPIDNTRQMDLARG